MPNWITETEAQDITGEVLSDAQITKAQIIIDSFSGVTTDVPQADLRDRDLLALKRATALQAAWMLRNPDVLTRWDSRKLTQSGVAVEFESADGMILAPLAKRWLKRLAWLQPKQIKPRARRRTRLSRYGGSGLGGWPTDEDCAGWVRM